MNVGPVGRSVVFLAPLVAAAVFYVWTRVTTVQLGYTLAKEAQRHEKLLEDNRALRVETSYLKRPERLESWARDRLRHGPPRPEQIVTARRSK